MPDARNAGRAPLTLDEMLAGRSRKELSEWPELSSQEIDDAIRQGYEDACLARESLLPHGTGSNVRYR